VVLDKSIRECLDVKANNTMPTPKMVNKIVHNSIIIEDERWLILGFV